MNRQEKESVVEFLKNEFVQNPTTFVIGYRGLTVQQLQNLRREIHGNGGLLKVAKARLMRRAVEGSSEVVCQLEPYLKDQIGLVFASDEAPKIAKILYNFSKDNEALSLVVGCLDDQLMDAQAIVRIAQLPSREVLLAQVCGTLKAPITGLANVLNQMPLRLLWALKELAQKKQQ